MKISLLSFNSEPLVLRYMSSYLKKRGHRTDIIYLKEKLNKENVASLIDFLRESKTDIVGFEVYTLWLKETKKLTKKIQKELGIAVIWGGAHAIGSPEECIKIADMVCIGEGEESLLELLNSMKKGKINTKIKNIWFREGNKIIKNKLRELEENLDKYPFPDYATDNSYVLEKERLRLLTKKDIDEIVSAKYSIIGSRGCIFSCTYCCNNQKRKKYLGLGKYFRRRSVKNVIEELRWAKDNFAHVRYVRIWDDLFMSRDIKELKEFCKLYKKYIDMPFSCRLQFALVTNEILDLLKDAGVRDIELGIESGSDRVRREVFKRFTPPEKILEVANELNKRKIDTVYNIIFNNPYENVDDLKEAIKLLIKFPRPLNLQGFNLIFLPGTDIYEKALKDKLITLQDFKTKIPNLPLFRFSYDNQVDNFIYKINFESKHKRYYNILLTLAPTFSQNFLDYATDNKNIFTSLVVYGYINLASPIKSLFTRVYHWIKRREAIKTKLSKLLVRYPFLIKIAQFRKWESMD